MDDDERDREQFRAAVSEDDIGHVVSAYTDRYRDPLTEILGRPVPDAEVAMWALLDEQQRKRALRRAHALIRWNEVADGLTARNAAIAAGVGLVRFYQMNSEWRTLPSLASLGVDAAPSKPRRSSIDPAVHAQLQVAIVDVVEADAKASVRRLALALAIELGKRTGLPEKELPSHNTLRAFIDRELRRRQREQEVGNDLLLDHSACGLLRPDRSTYTLFPIVDTASQIIMGAGLGDVADARAGYRLAARDALSRLGADDFRDLPWSDRVSRIQIVPGDDGTAPFQGVDLHGTAPGIGSNFTAERRAGDYLRKHVGSAIGVVPIWPARTGSAPPPASVIDRAPRLDEEKGAVRLGLEVDEYNSGILAELPREIRRPQPAGLERLLSVIAD